MNDFSTQQRLRGTFCPVHPDHRLALVGEAPGPRTRGDLPFYPYPASSAAGRLLRYLGWSRGDYLLTFARRNLLDEYPGPHFPVGKAKKCVPYVVAGLHPRPMLLMGRGVAAAFGAQHLPLLQMTTMTLPHEVLGTVEGRVAVIPHCSGRNLWYNDVSHQEQVREFINGLLGGEPREHRMQMEACA